MVLWCDYGVGEGWCFVLIELWELLKGVVLIGCEVFVVCWSCFDGVVYEVFVLLDFDWVLLWEWLEGI